MAIPRCAWTAHNIALSIWRKSGFAHGQAFCIRVLGRASECPGRSGLLRSGKDVQKSRDHGLEPANLDLIVREWAPRLALSEASIRSYLTENIYYYLDAACLEGLQPVLRYAAETGALPTAPDLRFVDLQKPV